MATGMLTGARFLLGLHLLLTAASTAWATPATDWLQQRSAADGAFRANVPLATDLQATTEALAALRARGLQDEPSATAGFAFVDAQPGTTTEELARRIQSRASRGLDADPAISDLLAHQNRDGGFGDRMGYTSTVLDTIWAVAALTSAGAAGTDPAGEAVQFLLSRQAEDGSWSDSGSASTAYTTSLALRSLAKLRDHYSLDAPIIAARDHLLSNRGTEGAIGAPYESGAALLAIAPTAATKDAYADLVTSLRDRQQPNGSWGDSVFATALAVQALALAEQPQPNPALGSLSLRLLDGETGAPLTSTSVTLSGPAERDGVSGDDGRVDLDNVPAGDYRLVATPGGYPSLDTAVRIEGGRTTELGVIKLLRSTDATVAHLTGIVTASVDGTPVVGAKISVTGAANAATTTDGNGNFTLTGLDPGAVLIEASSAGLKNAIAELELTGGRTTHIGLALDEVDSSTFSLFGQVTAVDSGEPVADATIVLTGAADASIATDGAGRYEVSGLTPGAVNLTGTAEGFGEVGAALSAEAGMNYRFSPALPSDGTTNADDNSILTGIVVDSITSQPVADASVQVTTTKGMWAVTTDAAGSFTVEGLSGESAALSISASNYDTASLGVSLSSGLAIDLGRITLTPSSGTASITISKRVLDSETNEPIAGALVESVYAGLNEADTSGADGRFTINVLAGVEGRIHISAEGYEPANIPVYFGSPNDGTKTGDFYLRSIGLINLQADLEIAAVDISAASTDSDEFSYSGAVSLSVRNLGGAAVSSPFRIEATRGSKVLGARLVETEIAARGGSTSIEIPLSGTVAFRDAPFRIIVDSESAIAESDEGNNELEVQQRCRVVPNGCPVGPPSNLGGWDSVQTEGTHAGSARWTLLEGNTVARLTGNFDPKMLISDFEFADATIVGTLRTTGFDNDWIGFVWGYQDAQHFYQFRWRKNGPRLMQVHRIDSASPLFNGVGTDDVLLFETLEGWERGVEYRYALDFAPGRAKITITEKGSIIESILVIDDAYTGGRFGFYNFSQGSSFYQASRVEKAFGIDLTAGRLEIVDRGSGNSPALRTRIGNAGAQPSPAGVIVSFYRGDPAAGGTVVATRELNEIPANSFSDIDVAPMQSIVGDEDLFVVVDPDNAIEELREDNNLDQASSVPASVLGSVGITTDAPAYAPAASAQIVAQALNEGAFSGSFSVGLKIEDWAGDIVADFGRRDLGTLASGATAEVSANWNTDGIVAAEYVAVATLYASDGSVADEAQTGITLQAATGTNPIATVSSAPRSAVYGPNDTVEVEHVVRNTSVNAVLSDADLTALVLDPDGIERARGTFGLGGLAAGAQRVRLSTHVLNGAPEGSWTVRAILRDAKGKTLAQDDGRFDVIRGLLDSVSGQVAVAHGQRYVGQAQTCSDTLINVGPAVEVELRRLVLDRERAVAVQTTQESLTLAAGETRTVGREIATGSLQPGVHACALQVEVDGTWTNLDHADFRLEPPPIDIEGGLGAGERGRLLVLLDPPAEQGQKVEDPHGPKGSPGPAEQRDWLEKRLDDVGWSYTVATDSDTFAEEFRSDGYVVVALLNEQVKIAEAVQHELVDAVEHDGLGLLVAGMHDRRNGRVEPALGVTSKGKLPHVEGLYLHDSEIGTADAFEFPIDDKPLRLDLQGARTLGDYTAVPKGQGKDPGPGLTVFEHGQGRSIDAGFDLLLQGTALGGDNRYGELMLAALDHVHPDPLVPSAGDVWPLRLTLLNEGLATPGRILIELPAGMAVVDPGEAGVDSGRLVWPFQLEAGEQAELDAWLRLPVAPGPVTVEALIQTGTAPDWLDHRTVGYTIPVQ